MGLSRCKTSRTRRDRCHWRVSEACSSYRGPSTSGSVSSCRWSDVGAVGFKTSRRRRDRCDRRVGKVCSSCRGPSTSEDVGSSRRGDVRVSSCETSHSAGIGAIGALTKPVVYILGSDSLETPNGGSKSDICEVSDWSA